MASRVMDKGAVADASDGPIKERGMLAAGEDEQFKSVLTRVGAEALFTMPRTRQLFKGRLPPSWQTLLADDEGELMSTTYGGEQDHRSHWACATGSSGRPDEANVITVQRKRQRGDARLGTRNV